jgi:hypothetical protein
MHKTQSGQRRAEKSEERQSRERKGKKKLTIDKGTPVGMRTMRGRT